MPRTPRSRNLAAALTALALATCSDKTPPAASCHCLSDPNPHCVSEDSCIDSSYCPSGTECVLKGASGSCKVVPPFTPLSALIYGFQVPGYAINEIPGLSQAAFSLTPPPETRTIACAVFSCVPIVKAVDGGPLAIVNYDQCVVAEQRYGAVSTIFDLSTSLPADPSAGPTSCLETPRKTGRRVTHWLAGCWFYGETNVIGATLLATVDPHRSFDYQDSFSFDCEVAFESCILSKGVFGTCSKSRSCARNCVVDADCNHEGSASRCDKNPGDFVGLCEKS